MKRLRYTMAWIILFALLIFSAAFSQSNQSRPNYHSGNKLRLTFFNNGVIGNTDEFAAEWPVGTGHEYLDLAFPVVAVETGGGPRVLSLQPVNSFAGLPDGQVAMNYLPETWPQSWPDRPANWDGKWDGFFGTDRLNADQESLYALEDAQTGIRVKVRGWQWSQYLAQDMVFLYYEITNTGSQTFDKVAAGFFAHPTPGSDGDDDLLGFNAQRASVTSVDRDNNGTGQGVASKIKQWSPVGRFTTEILETPGVDSDGIDNDGDGLVDESRFDGIDNDGDWNPATDDVGADGVPNSGDTGEGDGIPTNGEPNFDATDVDESDQLGLTSLAVFPAGTFDAANSDAVWNALTPGNFDDPANGSEFVLGSGYFSLAPGQTRRFSVVLFLSANPLDQQRNEEIVDQIYAQNYVFPVAPPQPQVTAVAQNGSITLYWNSEAENAENFEGYKIYRSTDPGFNDAYTVTDDKGVLIYSEPIATIDRKNAIKGFFPLQKFGFQYFLGKNSGLTHNFTDGNVFNGKVYYYAVVAYNSGDVDKGIFPTESTKSIIIDDVANVITDVNTVKISPRVESSGYQEANFHLENTTGFTTGKVNVELIDRRLVKNATYNLTFDESTPNEVTYSLVNVTNPQNPITIFANSTNYSTATLRNELDPMFDGMRIFLQNDKLRWDSLGTSWTQGNSNWTIQLELNNNLGQAIPVPADYEVRFGEVGVDTAIFVSPIPVPFEIWNVIDNQKQNMLLLDQNQNGAWDSGELIYLVEGDNLQNFRPVYWAVRLTKPNPFVAQSIPPEPGDVAFIKTRKPFSSRDLFELKTTPATVAANESNSVLKKIKVVPNPYIVSSGFEQLSMFTGGRTIRKLQFINLPQRCTIHIFNIRGVLLATLDHNSAIDNGTESWDLRSQVNRKTVSYGIYIYHIKAPGIGEKIGRFGIIR